MKTVLAAAVAVSAFASQAAARDLHVFVAPPFAPAYQAAAPACAAKVGVTLAAPPAAEPGGPPDSPAARVQRKLPLDVVIQTSPQVDQGIMAGLLAAGSKIDVANSPLGLASKAGSPKPGAATPEALRKTLLAAASFGYSAQASGDYVSKEVLPKQGIWDQVQAKGRVIRGEPVGAAVARGDVQLGFQQVVELMAIPGLEVSRVLSDIAPVATYSAAVGSSAQTPADARAFVACLASADSRPALVRVGLDPLAR